MTQGTESLKPGRTVPGPTLLRPGTAAGALVALGAAAALAVGFGVWPFLTVGAAIGGILFFATVRWPLAMVAVFLTLGPVDLSFLTGGFKELAPGLGGLDMNGIRLVSVSAGLWLVLLLDPKLRGLFVSRHSRWYVLFLAAAAVTIPFSLDPMEGARLWFKLSWPLLIFLMVAHPDRTPAQLERLGDWILIGASAIVLINPLFVLAGGYEFDFDGRLRVHGVGLHQNPFSFYLLFISLFALTRFAHRMQARYLLLAMVTLTWMGLTLTRISFLAGLVALVAAGLYAGFVHRSPRMVAAVGALAAVLAAAFIPVALERTFGYVPSVPELWYLFQHPVLLYETVNLQGRELYWGLLYAAWAQSPWLGLGLGSSTAVITSVLPPEFGTVAHNEYLRLGTDLGWVGLGLMAVAAWAWARGAWGGGRPSAGAAVTPRDESRRGEWVFPALAGLLVWAVISITDNAIDYYAPFSQFVGFAVGVAVAMNRWEARLKDSPEARPTPSPGP